MKQNNRAKHAKQMGLNNRKYEEKCSYCGKEEHYAKGYCKNCYARYVRNGFVEPKYDGRSKRLPKLTKKQIRIFLKDLKKFKKENKISKNNCKQYYDWINKKYKPTFRSVEKVYSNLGIDIYSRLKIKGGDKQ